MLMESAKEGYFCKRRLMQIALKLEELICLFLILMLIITWMKRKIRLLTSHSKLEIFLCLKDTLLDFQMESITHKSKLLLKM